MFGKTGVTAKKTGQRRSSYVVSLLLLTLLCSLLVETEAGRRGRERESAAKAPVRKEREELKASARLKMRAFVACRRECDNRCDVLVYYIGDNGKYCTDCLNTCMKAFKAQAELMGVTFW
ncbi:uncharacterized protein LOC106156875 [Lingula anatina]|uniref:Uncharacterized protein LOC106156875 n=1 Tax=Lingula anatina TaxID=7574 RepID=A0A1S3HRS8_LINAN|nr:uncharacterized protein LOC106156875 [Lingula anatina]|eukprot:XP_013387759.1 uncharacterized protein LOC106156875 [Lingula anatina]